jgi:two-component system NtrC family sensor kinase
MAGTAQDITNWRRAREERLLLEKELREGHEMRLLGQLTAGVAHEVRNPLNGILALSEALILEVGDNPGFRRYIQLMWEQAKRLSALMEDLLTLGKPAEPESYADIPVGAFVESTVRDWRQTLLAVHHPVSVRVAESAEGCTIKGNASRLEQVVINLLDNAAGHSAEGSETTVSVDCRGEALVSIQVRDRGPGISPEDLPKVFDPFFTTRKGGVGLGLAIVRSIIERHGGDVSVRNNTPEPGVSVEVRLPLAAR